MDDAVSKWLLSNWYTPYFDHPNMLAAVALARFFNLPSTLEAIMYDVLSSQGDPWWDRMKGTLRIIKGRGETVFNAAYMVRGNDGEDKISSVVDFYVKPLVDDPPVID